MATKKDKERKLTVKERIIAIGRVARITFLAAPVMVVVQVFGIFITAILPLAVTYFAALTTTALAEAYAGSQPAGQQAIVYVIITAALGIVMTVWRSVEQYLTQVMRYKVEAGISDRMYEHFLMLDFWRYDDKHTADLYDRAKKFSQFFAYIFDHLTSIVSQFITMVAGIIALIFVSWWLGAIVLLAVIPGIYIQFKLSRTQAKHWNENVETRRAKGQIEWNLFQPQYIAELRLYSLVRYLLNLRMDLRDRDEKARIEFERKYIFKRLGADVLEAGAEVTALLFTVTQIIARTQPIGQFLYVQQVVSRALGGASSFVSQISTIDEDLVNLFDYQEFMELPVFATGIKRLTSAPNELVLSDVTFKYPASTQNVLEDVSLTLKEHQHIAIVGENGAGKSTLIKIITGLYQPTSGSMYADNIDFREIDIASWHTLLGVLRQDYTSYSFASAKDNVYLGDVSAPFDQTRFDQALERAEAAQFIKKLPRGIDSYVHPWMEDDEGNVGTDLSGGQWQRLALARNFYRDSPIIILDEPTSAIDALAEDRIFRHIFADKKRTVITISHRLTTVKRADVIYMLKEGRLVESGTHRELVEKRGAYYTMFKSQLDSDAK
ncbi:MAG: msbA2 [Candidatus Saccharibacteria bacterium]|nr:msbA2 [Candidatus Saccharibacteria bacterium]